MFICSLAANRHLETYAQDTGAGMSLIHFLVSFSLLISVMRYDVRCGRAKVTLMKPIKRLKETKKCIRDMPAPVSASYVSRCLLAVTITSFDQKIIHISKNNRLGLSNNIIRKQVDKIPSYKHLFYHEFFYT